MRNFISIAALASASIIALAAPAMAQEAAPQQAAEGPDANSDIIVTAQRRQEKVTEVPISITVANQAQLERQQVNTVNDLNRIAPSLEINSAPGQNTGGGGAIRGVGTQTFSPGAVASVGVVVDQVSQGNANISDLFDVSRIEVLKGPQGTLFGLTTSAGVINITTNAPDPTGFSARVRTELSDAGTAGSKFGNQVIQGVVNIPTSANSALRVSGVTNLRQGVNYNTLAGGWVDNNRYGVRGRFMWEPTADLTVNVIGDYTKAASNYGGDFFTFLVAPTQTAELAACGITAGEGNQNICTTFNPALRTQNFGSSLQIDYDAGPFTLSSISAIRRSTQKAGRGTINRVDTLSTQLYTGPTDNKIDLLTQELRVSSPANRTVEYTVGAFISRQKTVQQPEPFSVVISPFPGVQIPVVDDPGAFNEAMDESMAVYGQSTIHLGDAFRVIAGGRYTAARLSLDTTPLGGTLSRSKLNTEKFSYKLGAQYDLAGDTMVYGFVARGFKGGQVSIPTGLAPVILQPEVPTSYEVGLKTTLFGGWVLDLNGFYQKVRNFQAQNCTVDVASQQLLCAQANISEVKSRGAEINLFGKVTEHLTVNTGLIYSKTTYPNGFVGSDQSDLGGAQLAFAPRYKFTFSGEYEQPLTERFSAFLAGDAVWKSRIRYEQTSNIDTTFAKHWIMGGRIGVRTEDERFSVAAFARNLLNKHEPSLFLTGGADALALYGPQSFRQVGLQLDAKF